jgi:hypothetical protein
MLGFVTNIGMKQNVGWVERSETQKIKVRNKGNVGFRYLNPTYKISDRATHPQKRSPFLIPKKRSHDEKRLICLKIC